MSTQYSPRIITDGLVLCLDAASRESYLGTGTIWRDLVGSTNGTLTNGVGFSAANAGTLTFDGVDDYVQCTFANPFAETIIVWARSATTNWNTYGWVSSSRRENGHIFHCQVGSREMYHYILDGSANYYGIGGYSIDDITIPHMYVMTTNGSNSHMIYLDNGVLKNNDTTSITRSSSPANVSWRLGEDDTLGRFGNGNIYSCLRYNRVLSQSEIQQNYNATKGRFGL